MKNVIDYIYEFSMNDKIQGMNSVTIKEIIDYVQYQLEDIIRECDLDIEIIELYAHGSRINGTPRKDSDLDIVLYYKGNVKEDSLFNILHDDEYTGILTYDNVYIDINPIRDEETGSLKKYIEKDKKYKK